MPQKTLTRADLTAAIHQEIGMSVKEGNHFVDEVLDNMITALAGGNDVKISNFGTFTIRQKEERIGRNPKTNEEALVSARRVVIFKASLKLNELVSARSK